MDQEQIIKQMEQKQLDPSQSRHGDHQESSGLLHLGGNQSIRGNKSFQKADDEKNNKCECTWVLWLGVLFFIVVGVVVYRYVNSSYQFKLTDKLVDSIDNGKLINDNISSKQSRDDHSSTNHEQTTSVSQLRSKHEQNSITKAQQQQQEYQQQPFLYPYTLWRFTKTSLNHNDYTHNIQHYTSPSQASIKRINTNNYKQLIKSKTVLQSLQKLTILNLSQQKQQQFIQHLVMFSLLYQNGGMIIGGDLVLTQTLDDSVMGFVRDKKQAFRMFLCMHEKTNGNSVQIDIDLQNYFIVAGKHFGIIKEIVTLMAIALQQQIASTFPSSSNLLIRYRTQFSQLFQLKHKQFITQLKSTQPQTFLQHLKIFSFNNIDSLNIVQPYLIDLSMPQQFQYLYSYQEQQLYQLIGKLNPIVHLPQKQYSQFLIQLQTSQHPVVQHSFLLQHMLSFSSTYSTLKPLAVQPSQLKYSQWKLPKILWTFVNKINQKSPLHDYFITNLITIAQQSQFQLIVLTQQTIQNVLDAKQLHEIFSSFKHKQTQQDLQKDQQILSQLIKLYVLKRYGGVYVDFGYFLLQKLDWVPRIKSNQHLFNNVNKDPQVLMFHNHSSVHEWEVNINSGVKIARNLLYITKGFIAVTKSSKFITHELDVLVKQLNQAKDKQQAKQPQLPQTFNQFQQYKIWSISSLLGGTKMDIVISKENSQCYDFTDSLFIFKQKYGSLGYVSELVTDVQKQQLQNHVSTLDDDSIFQQFFINRNVDLKQVEKIMSLKEVSLAVQRIQK